MYALVFVVRLPYNRSGLYTTNVIVENTLNVLTSFRMYESRMKENESFVARRDLHFYYPQGVVYFIKKWGVGNPQAVTGDG